MKLKIGFALLFLIPSALFAQRAPNPGEVVLNEFVAAPQTTETSEWVELYNTTIETLDIGGMYIDDIGSGGGAPKQIPLGTTISPNGFYVMTFDSFLNNAGDDVRLLSSDQYTIFDTFTYPSAVYDMSYSRVTDGGEWNVSQTVPTMGTSNSPTGAGVWSPGNLEIHVINVGQGMAQLVIGPTGRTMLMDLAELNWNTDQTAIFVASEIRRITGGSHLNYILASHLHLDHVGYVGYGGIWSLVEEQGITIDKLIDRNAGTWIDSNGDKIPDYDTEIVYYNAGTLSGTSQRWIAWVTDPLSSVYSKRESAINGSTTQIDLGGDVIVKVVLADGEDVLMADGTTPIQGDHTAEPVPPSENDYSTTIWINWNNFDYIFGGDTDGEYATSSWGYTYNDVESIVAQRINQEVEVISVNHHGSDHSSNDSYVSTLNPQVAIYNVGANSYGHPAQRVLDLFYSIGTKQYLTAMGDVTRNYLDSSIVNGNVVIKSEDGYNYTVNDDIYLAVGADIPPVLRVPVIGEVVINEFLADTYVLYTSEFVELYNTTNDNLDISYMYIDDLANGGGAPKQIPADTIIPPNGFYLMDGFNNYLNNAGDDVRLLAPDGTTQWDIKNYTTSSNDTSWGRIPNGGSWSSTQLDPTPGVSNN